MLSIICSPQFMALVDALSELEEIAPGEKPWCDLVFDVVEHWLGRSATGTDWLSGRTLADLRGETIGFTFHVPVNGWGSDEERRDAPTFYWSRIRLGSAGPETDRLVAYYVDWFDLPAMKAEAVPIIECSAIALHDGLPNFLAEKCSFKLFFEVLGASADAEISEGDQHYAELYFNMDLPRKRAWLREKDPGYRQPLLRFLTGALRTGSSIV